MGNDHKKEQTLDMIATVLELRTDRRFRKGFLLGLLLWNHITKQEYNRLKEVWCK
jgi:hypothetical protein